MIITENKNLVLIYKIVLVILALCSIFFGLFFVFYLRMPFPFQDMVEVFAFLDKDPLIFSLDGITKFHDMEHRPVLPMFFWYLDREFFGSIGLMPLIVSNLFFLIIAILVTNLWTPKFKLKQVTSWSPILSGVALIFSLLNWHNLMWEKQLHLSFSLLLLITAILLINKHDKKFISTSGISSYWLIFLINLLCWAAAFSFGYGIPISFLLLLHGFAMRWPIKQLLICIFSSLLLVFTYIYLLSLRDQGIENLFITMHSIWSILPYIAGLLGSIFSSIGLEHILEISPGSIAPIAGYIMLFLFFYKLVSHYHKIISGNIEVIEIGSSALLICLSCIGMAAITWFSRPIETGGIVDRYFIVSSIFIISLPGIFISKEYWRRASRWSGFVLHTLIIAFITISLLGHISNYSKLRNSWHLSSLAAIGANYEIYIPGPNQIIGPPLHQSKKLTESVWGEHKLRLKNYKKLIPFDWHGKKLNDLFNDMQEDSCEGGIRKIISVPGYRETLVFEAWTRNLKNNIFISDWILAVDQNGKIIGLGSSRRQSFLTGSEGFIQNLRAIMNQNYSRNAGYILSKGDQVINFYSVNGRDVCKFASTLSPQS